MRFERRVRALAILLLGALMLLWLPGAEANPLTGGAPPPAPSESGPWQRAMQYVIERQGEFQRRTAGAIRELRDGGIQALGGLFLVAFLYGVFHAAGPGHGKAVVASYLLADGRQVRRGLMLALLSALAQGVTAVLLVGIPAGLLGLAGGAVRDLGRFLELAGAALIAGFGLWLALRVLQGRLDHGHGHHHHDHDHHHHAHASLPVQAAGTGRLLALAGAVGLRPCSGALLILVFTLTQGVFWAGILATLVMSLGTAATVALLALLAVHARGLAARLTGARARGASVFRAMTFLAALAVAAFGALLFAASWNRAGLV
ncbi:MAG: delayed-early response protein/equilibrative nucleoside transporter [Alphaproteobacteria bacterium]|nr:delayed-early response protein/equilibrative nucleoside transporter [Alphaproteobacteria bacterium]